VCEESEEELKSLRDIGVFFARDCLVRYSCADDNEGMDKTLDKVFVRQTWRLSGGVNNPEFIILLEEM
jgi:hypothetical protein